MPLAPVLSFPLQPPRLLYRLFKTPRSAFRTQQWYTNSIEKLVVFPWCKSAGWLLAIAFGVFSPLYTAARIFARRKRHWRYTMWMFRGVADWATVWVSTSIWHTWDFYSLSFHAQFTSILCCLVYFNNKRACIAGCSSKNGALICAACLIWFS